MIDFNKIVNKMLKKGGKVILKEDIFDLIDPEKKEVYASYVDKLIYRLKSEGIIIPLKSGVYVVPDSEKDKNLNRVDLLEKYYFKLLKKYITYFVGNEYFISGRKALEVHMKNFEIPQKIFITNRNINKKIKIGSLEIIFKTISGKIDKLHKAKGESINLYAKLKSLTIKKEIEGIEFSISGLELSLVEASLVNDVEMGLPVELLSKALKKYGDVFDTSIFYELGKLKFSMSFNRLKELAKPVNHDISLVFLDIIKKNGSLFIGEGLRGFK